MIFQNHKSLFFLIFKLFITLSTLTIDDLESTIAKNPLVTIDDESYPDPWIILVNDVYYYCGSEDSARLYLTFSSNLHDIINQPKQYIYTPPPGFDYSQELWAPELHFLENKWYVYFAADNGQNENHRMFVLEGGSDPLNAYTMRGKLAPPTDKWAIDGSPFLFENKLYYVWSGWPGDTNVMQCLYISTMSNPYTLNSDRVEISCPTEYWERNGYPYINEGPEILISNRAVSIVYSASGSWTDEYCLGVLTCSSGNLMQASCWRKRGPAFGKFERVYGTGHASFTTSKDGLQHWIVYHAAKYQAGGWDRNVRIQQFTFHEDVPYFVPPVQPGVYFALSASSSLASGLYKISSKFSGLYVSILRNSLVDNAAIVSSSSSNVCDTWEFLYQATGWYKIKATCSGKILDNAGASLEAGNKLIQYTENENEAQLWRVENMENGYFKIFNKRSLLYLDAPGYNNIPVIQWYASNDDTQLFSIVSATVSSGKNEGKNTFSKLFRL